MVFEDGRIHVLVADRQHNKDGHDGKHQTGVDEQLHGRIRDDVRTGDAHVDYVAEEVGQMPDGLEFVEVRFAWIKNSKLEVLKIRPGLVIRTICGET